MGDRGEKLISFEGLDAWKMARNFNGLVYRLTDQSVFRKDPELKMQLRRAALSVMNNIAEGFERSGKQEKLNFLNYARASCGEVRSMTYVLEDLGLPEIDVQPIRETSIRTGKLISGLIRSLTR
ncbi:MAG: four helix bundle protein [Verrucomicrobiota bacterium]